MLSENTDIIAIKSAFKEKRNRKYVPANAPVANNTNIKDLISRCRSKVRLEKLELEDFFCT